MKKSLLLSLAMAVGVYGCSDQAEELTLSQESKGIKAEALTARDLQLEEFAKNLATTLNDPQMRLFLKEEALKQFDDDFDILYGQVAGKEVGGTTLRQQLMNTKGSNARLLSNDAILDDVPLLNIAIPVQAEAWNAESYVPKVAFVTEGFSEQTTSHIKAYDADGKVYWLDAKNKPEETVIVVGVNERMVMDPSYIEPCLQQRTKPDYTHQGVNYYNAFALCGGGGGGDTGGGGTTTNYCRPVKGTEYLKGYSFADVSEFEAWALGAPEVWVEVQMPRSSTSFSSVYKGLHKPGSRSTGNNNSWYNFSTGMFYWNVPAGDPDALCYNFYEEDGGDSQIKVTPTIGFKIFGISQSVKLEFTLKNNDDQIGFRRMTHAECADFYKIGSGSGQFSFRTRNY